MHPLDGPRLKVRRAFNQLNALDQAIKRFFKREPYAIVVNPDEKPGWYVARAQVLNDVDPMWGVIVGEIAHDLKSALDGIVWRFAKCHSGVESTITEFPIFLIGHSETSKRTFQSQAWRRRELGGRHKAFLERLQPYKRGNFHRRSPLWLLHELNIADKHRTIQLVGANAEEVAFSIPGGQTLSGFSMRTGIMRRNVPFIDGAKLGEAQIWQPDSRRIVRVCAETSLGIQFSEGCDAVKKLQVVPTLRAMASRVRNIVEMAASDFFS